MKDVEQIKRQFNTAYEEVKRLKEELKGENEPIYTNYIKLSLKTARLQVRMYALDLINYLHTNESYIFKHNPRYELRNNLRLESIESDREAVEALSTFMGT